MFDDEFINNLPEDPMKAAHAMCEKFFDVDRDAVQNQELENYEIVFLRRT